MRSLIEIKAISKLFNDLFGNPRRFSKQLTLLGCSVWLCFVLAGYAFVLFYEGVSGHEQKKPASFPSTVGFESISGQFTLVMFLHPRCPCSDSTLSELSALLTHCPQLKTYLLFLQPQGLSEDWARSRLWFRAKNIPGVIAILDKQGAISEKFKASTSGETLLYNPAGQLVFSGGITSSRGHEGDNQGVDTIEALVSGTKDITVKTTPVFGCPLADNPHPNDDLMRLCQTK